MERKQIVTLAFALSCIGATAFADTPDDSMRGMLRPERSPSEPCVALIKGCLSHTGTEYAQCLYSSGHHPFCQGLEIGTLALKRFRLSSPTADPGNADPGSADQSSPVLLDADCLKKFDAQLSSAVIAGNVSAGKVTSLDRFLDGCRRQPTDNFLRP